MRRSAWFKRSWHSRDSLMPCSKSSRLVSSGRSPCSSLPTIFSSSSSELSKVLVCDSFLLIQSLIRSFALRHAHLTRDFERHHAYHCRNLESVQTNNSRYRNPSYLNHL